LLECCADNFIAQRFGDERVGRLRSDVFEVDRHFLAFLGISMLDGLELTRRLRADLRTAAIPVLLLSARAGETARIEGFLAGADEYIEKPFGARELIARIAAAVRLARSRTELAQRERQIAVLARLSSVVASAMDRKRGSASRDAGGKGLRHVVDRTKSDACVARKDASRLRRGRTEMRNPLAAELSAYDQVGGGQCDVSW
jgi:CheY-like chemotaxis protein